MLYLTEDTLRYIKKMYTRKCIEMFMVGALGYVTFRILVNQGDKIDILEKEVKELQSKGE